MNGPHNTFAGYCFRQWHISGRKGVSKTQVLAGFTYNDLHAALGRVKFDKILISQYTILFGIHQLIKKILVVVTDITIPKDCISIEWHAHFIP
jgi:hypothetical protein